MSTGHIQSKLLICYDVYTLYVLKAFAQVEVYAEMYLELQYFTSGREGCFSCYLIV